jgi:hypothetical protein
MIDNLLKYENEDDHHVRQRQNLSPNTSIRRNLRNYNHRETTRSSFQQPENATLLNLLIQGQVLVDRKILKRLPIDY